MNEFAIPFANGSSLPIAVTWDAAGEYPPTNRLKPSTHTFGESPATQVTVTLTPGAVIPAPPPVGPQAITLPAGFVPITRYTQLAKNYEFNGPGLPADWSAHEGDDGYATTDYDASGISFDGGAMLLTLREAVTEGGHPYTSGMAETAGAATFTYGQFDAVVLSIPREVGMWPAFWLISAANVEIDVVEILGQAPDTVYATVHTSDGGPSQTFSGTVDTTKPVTYSLVWEPGIITMAANGYAFAQMTAEAWATTRPGAWNFDDAELGLRLNLGASYPGGWGDPPDASTVFPATMRVASVKVWQ